MLKHGKRSWVGGVFIAMSATILLTQDAIAQKYDTPVTDPDMLEAMGFEKDMTNVYISEGINLESLTSEADLSSADLFSQKQINLAPSGTTDYSPISPKEFSGRIDTTGTQWKYSAGNGVELSRLGTEMFADAQFSDLPNGGTLKFYRWWWSDNDSESALTTFVFEVCQPSFSGGAITFTTIATSTSFDAANGSTVITIPDRPINTQSCYYLARARFDAATSLLRLQKVRLQFTHP